MLFCFHALGFPRLAVGSAQVHSDTFANINTRLLLLFFFLLLLMSILLFLCCYIKLLTSLDGVVINFTFLLLL